MRARLHNSHYLIGAMFVTLIACAPADDFAKFSISPSADTSAHAYLPLVPVSFFDIQAFTPVNATNLAGRAARLRAKIRAMAGPVIPARDRARMEAAIARR